MWNWLIVALWVLGLVLMCVGITYHHGFLPRVWMSAAFLAWALWLRAFVRASRS